jgi:hypothetical protein
MATKKAEAQVEKVEKQAKAPSFEQQSIMDWMRNHTERVAHMTSYAELMNSLRSNGPRETEEGVSFFDETVDQGALDELIQSLGS